jgi:hypothetical protein
MTTDRELQRLLDRWLEDGPIEVADRVIDDIADRIEQVPQRPAWRLRSWRTTRMKLQSGLAAAAAIVLVAAVVAVAGFRFGPSTGGGAASVTPPAGASGSPRPSTAAPGSYIWPVELAAGTYTTSLAWDLPYEITFTVPAGWSSRDIEVIKDPLRVDEKGGPGGVAVSFTLAENVMADPCGVDVRTPPVGPSAMDLATALAALPGFTATTPETVEFDRVTRGVYLELRVNPAALACTAPDIHLWTLDPDRFRTDRGPTGGAIWGAEQPLNRIWILDVEGTRLVIDAVSALDATPATLAELQAVVDSVRFERPGQTPPPEPAPS